MASVPHQGQSAVFGKRREPHTVIIARGDQIRHFTVRPWLAALLGSAAAAVAIGYLLATSYLVLRDDLIGAAVSRQARMQQAYEDRISALRAQVDRITSRQLLDQQLVETKVGELLERQKQLSLRHGRLGDVLERAEKLEKDLPDSPPAPAASPKEHADAGAAADGMSDASMASLAALWNTRSSLNGGESAADRADRLFVAINRSLGSIEKEQLSRVRALSQKARQTGDAVKQALLSAGLKIDDKYGEEDVGGPLIAVNNGMKFDTEVKELDEQLDRLDALKAEMQRMPLANPEPGEPVTSGFGIRRDPLLGVAALHPGIDFRAPVGSAVPATAAGTVTRAGWAGGYGRMVEIDHGNGYATRYAHLSQIDVKVHEKVKRGQVIGRSGSTGRSTGPHLHYEVRHNGEPVDPVDFLRAGRRISQFL